MISYNIIYKDVRHFTLGLSRMSNRSSFSSSSTTTITIGTIIGYIAILKVHIEKNADTAIIPNKILEIDQINDKVNELHSIVVFDYIV